MRARVTGQQRVISNIRKERHSILYRVVEAVEKTAVDVVNAAKANHEAGAHSMGRYENKTTLLTQSMHASDPDISSDKVAVLTVAPREYAADVELGTPASKPYPYMYPALMQNQENLKARLAKATKGG